MRLALYASTPRASSPNLVALQDESFSALPTVLVCPLRADAPQTAFGAEVIWQEQKLIACTELVRPIRRTALRPMGRLEDAVSRTVMERFLRLLAR